MSIPSVPSYRGRFAPSPTGTLHFGSLVAAAGSYLDARWQGGEWWVRMEDLDTPRVVPGAADDILRTLEAYGFVWDGPVLYQSTRLEAYAEALQGLQRQGLAYGCSCSRKQIAANAAGMAIDGGLRYPGTCRAGIPAGQAIRAWRFRVPEAPVAFTDRVQGACVQHLARDVGDFVLKRADGLFAYQLAVVVDDAWQGMTDVVRGADLLDSTPRQIALQQALGLTPPRYAHLPVATNPAGEKWSKQTLAPALSSEARAATLIRALRFLGQAVPEGLDSVAAVWAWALAHPGFHAIPRCRAQVAAA